MISFRYHLISVIAIFLALALGVVVGTTALKGAVVGDLHRQVSDLKASNKSQTALISGLQGAAGNANSLVQAYGPKITAGTLANSSVALVGGPSATPALVSALGAAITSAGGTVAGQVQLTSAFTDPSRGNDIRSLATGVQLIGLTLPQTDDPGSLAGALLGWVLLGHAQAPTDVQTVLSGFSKLGMATVTGNPAAGKALLLVDPGAKTASDPGMAMLASMSTEIAVIGGPTLVLGDSASATSGGLIALLRSQDTAKRALSTVDGVDTPLGQLTTVLVTAEALAGRKGQYGTAAGADGLLPGANN